MLGAATAGVVVLALGAISGDDGSVVVRLLPVSVLEVRESLY